MLNSTELFHKNIISRCRIRVKFILPEVIGTGAPSQNSSSSMTAIESTVAASCGEPHGSDDGDISYRREKETLATLVQVTEERDHIQQRRKELEKHIMQQAQSAVSEVCWGSRFGKFALCFRFWS